MGSYLFSSPSGALARRLCRPPVLGGAATCVFVNCDTCLSERDGGSEKFIEARVIRCGGRLDPAAQDDAHHPRREHRGGKRGDMLLRKRE